MKVRFANNIPTVEEIASLCGGKVLGDGTKKVDSVCTDSREAGEGTMFIAIVGERVDGHNFIKSVIASGAVCALCSRIPEEAGDFPITSATSAREGFSSKCRSIYWRTMSMSFVFS